MHVSFHEGYRVDLPPTHPYPMGKYLLLRDVLAERGLIGPLRLVLPDEVPMAVLERVHTPEYLAQLQGDSLDPAQRRRLGIPFTPRLWRRSRLTVEGTRLAAAAALADGLAANMAGGTHHAFADHGEGFCVINDVAVALTDLFATQRIRRALIVDLDVHQGNGTAEIFRKDKTVITFSMHQQMNYPFIKPPSDLDVGLDDGCGDTEYLQELRDGLAWCFEKMTPDLIFYVAGADPYCDDQLGGLALTIEGLLERDRTVFAAARERGIPVAACFAGGYARRLEDTVSIHTNTIRAMAGQ